LGLLASGCPNPNIYGSPRTLPAGKVSHTIAVEGVGYHFTRRDAYVEQEGLPRTASAATLVPPSYSLRVGIADRFDFGFRAANMSSLGVDIKGNFLRSEVLDLALDPFVQWSFLGGVDTTHVHLPLLVGFNASPKITVLLTPGMMYGVSSFKYANDADLSELKQLMGTNGFYARLGLGLDARLSKKFAIHPEITVLKALNPPTDSVFESTLMYTFGFGFVLGAQPDYSDLAGAAPPAASPAPAQ
jgi:hypothetical protein